MSWPPGANGVFGLFSNVMDVQALGADRARLPRVDLGDPATSARRNASGRSRSRGLRRGSGTSRSVAEINRPPALRGDLHGRRAIRPPVAADRRRRAGRAHSRAGARESTALGAAMYAAVGAVSPASVSELGATTRFRGDVRARCGRARGLPRDCSRAGAPSTSARSSWSTTGGHPGRSGGRPAHDWPTCRRWTPGAGGDRRGHGSPPGGRPRAPVRRDPRRPAHRLLRGSAARD